MDCSAPLRRGGGAIHQCPLGVAACCPLLLLTCPLLLLTSSHSEGPERGAVALSRLKAFAAAAPVGNFLLTDMDPTGAGPVEIN